MDKLPSPSFEQTLDYTKDSLASMLFTLYHFLKESGYSDEDASKETLRISHAVFQKFSDDTVQVKFPKPNDIWVSEFDEVLKSMRGKKELYGYYQRLLRIRKKLK